MDKLALAAVLGLSASMGAGLAPAPRREQEVRAPEAVTQLVLTAAEAKRARKLAARRRLTPEKP